MYVYIIIRDPMIIKRARVGILLTGLTLPHFCACSNTGPRFPTSNVIINCCVLFIKVRSDCSFCWYWWNCCMTINFFSLTHSRNQVLSNINLRSIDYIQNDLCSAHFMAASTIFMEQFCLSTLYLMFIW